MKKIAKYITAAVLAVCLLCMTAISALAYTEGYFRYEVTDGVITITEYFGREENVTVPNMIAGTPVSIIGENVFPDGCGVKTVNLPDTIMQVQDNSFGASVNVVYAVIPEQTTTTAPAPIEPTVTEPSVSDNTGGAPVMPYTSAADIVTTRTEDGAVYIVEDTAEDNSEELAEDIGEGGMEEVEEIFDDEPAVTAVPDNTEETPAEDTAETAAPAAETTNQPAESKVSLAVNDDGQLVAVDENGSETVIDENTGYTVSTDAEGNTVVLDDKGEQVKAEDIVTAAVEPAVSERAQSNVLPIIIVVAAVVIIVAVVIIIVKRKK
ncbi:MAG: hypothetical protein ACI4J7_11625 [Ruminiclostridium sp.]